MTWLTQVLILIFFGCSVLAAPMWGASSSSATRDFQMQRYEELYHTKIRYLGFVADPEDKRQILKTNHLELTSLHKYIKSTHREMSADARQAAVNNAVKHANDLGKKLKVEIQGPLHPDNIGTQIQAAIIPLQADYDNFFLTLNHVDNAFAKARIYDHPDNGPWADYASAFSELVTAAIPLIGIRG